LKYQLALIVFNQYVLPYSQVAR